MHGVGADPWNKLRKRGYRLKHMLGTGKFSKVREAVSPKINKAVAIKCINTNAAPKEVVDNILPWQLEKLLLLRHDNIVKVYEIFEAKGGLIFIVMEAARNGDLLRHIRKNGPLPEPEIRIFFWQLCQAIKYCHTRGICHGNLKCENVLLDVGNRLLLCDCGFSKPTSVDGVSYGSAHPKYYGKLEYASPEVLDGQFYEPRVQDLWSIGVILYMMACGRIPFDASNRTRMLKEQKKNQMFFPRKINKTMSLKLKNLISCQLQTDLTQRTSMKKILLHPFF